MKKDEVDKFRKVIKGKNIIGVESEIFGYDCAIHFDDGSIIEFFPSGKSIGWSLTSQQERIEVYGEEYTTKVARIARGLPERYD